MTEIAEAAGRPAQPPGTGTACAYPFGLIDAVVGADGQLACGTRTAYVLALHMDLLPPDLRAAAAGRPAAATRREGGHLTTGFVGVGYLLPVLCSTGYADLDRIAFSLELPPDVAASVRIPSDDPAAVRDQAGAGPEAVAGYPGALGGQAAVFTAGSGSHQFAGPALTGNFS